MGFQGGMGLGEMGWGDGIMDPFMGQNMGECKKRSQIELIEHD